MAMGEFDDVVVVRDCALGRENGMPSAAQAAMIANLARRICRGIRLAALVHAARMNVSARNFLPLKSS
ncbi:hypothetical protein RY831_07110 [Noviherbaspirillum sp. CPCC 100848]|uniref:Uncharacterized protein n=1 Tax=Noviherbaspirillum album TaxID=3080276 RepID=A0ABU6J5J5_9BURK|nr:hypothetical protein [Noviherbaspirillum sp. CPCC 100848]MEC4718909.1 hypothetical protein [Noviherbaspirillum sp. CPCC 100848]